MKFWHPISTIRNVRINTARQQLINYGVHVIVLTTFMKKRQPKKKHEKKELHLKKIKKELTIAKMSKRNVASLRSVEQQTQAKSYLTNFGKIALLKATCRGDVVICRYLITRCDVNCRDKHGGTALMYAVMHGHEDICQLLLDADADVAMKCPDGWTSLMYAASQGHTETCRHLIRHGAKADAKNGDGLSALMIAVQRGHAATCKVLLQSGGDVNDKQKDDGRSVLMTAIQRKQMEVVEVLLEAGAKVEDEDKKGTTVKMVAAKWKNKTFQKKLVEHMQPPAHCHLQTPVVSRDDASDATSDRGEVE